MARRPAITRQDKPASRVARGPKGKAPGAGVDTGAEDRPDKPLDQPDRGPAAADASPPARVSVEVNTLISRPDLGPNAKTFVAAGDLIPLGLEGYPRGPA
jgi:hypothetical protein